MSLLILGSVAIDSIKTPVAEANEVPGGAAVYASVAASHFVNPSIIGVIGTDFKDSWLSELKNKNIDVTGLERKEGKTFRWKGVYNDFNKAITLDTQLNVFSNFQPKLNQLQAASDFILLGNIDPDIQYDVLSQVDKNTIVAVDTMNFWINSKKEKLKKVIAESKILFINEEEANLLAQTRNIHEAIKNIKEYFNGIIIIKRGGCGAFIYNDGSYFFAPAYPTINLFDTTGAGDSFAGAFMGYLAKISIFDFNTAKRALIYGNSVASYTIESFSIFNLLKIKKSDIEKRFEEISKMMII